MINWGQYISIIIIIVQRKALIIISVYLLRPVLVENMFLVTRPHTV